MRWSKLKQTIENKFSDKLRKRLEIFNTVYDEREPAGRVWITIDKEEIANFCDYNSGNQYGSFYNETTTLGPSVAFHKAIENKDRTPGKLVEKGEFSRFDAEICFNEYLDLSIEQALNHKSPIINSLAMADKRLGKRRIMKIETKNLHPLVKRILEFRKEVEDIKINPI